jgi:hypothetical protein
MTTPTTKALLTFTLAASTLAVTGCSSNAGDSGDENVAADESSVSVSANEKTAYEFFVNKGLKNFEAAAIVGNLQQESNVNPTIAQYGGGPGRGIAQWSEGGRWNADHDDNVAWYAANHGASEWSLTLQLEFIWYELTTFSSYGLSELRGASTLSAATIAFQDRFEGCGACDQSNRIADAQAVLNAYGSGGGGGGGAAAAGCYSSTLGKEMPNDACVQSKSNTLWYECDDGAWVDRWNDPANCDGVHPLEGVGCFSSTLNREMPDNACVQSAHDHAWYQCANGAWDDRWTDPAACDGVYPL